MSLPREGRECCAGSLLPSRPQHVEEVQWSVAWQITCALTPAQELCVCPLPCSVLPRGSQWVAMGKPLVVSTSRPLMCVRITQRPGLRAHICIVTPWVCMSNKPQVTLMLLV